MAKFFYAGTEEKLGMSDVSSAVTDQRSSDSK